MARMLCDHCKEIGYTVDPKYNTIKYRKGGLLLQATVFGVGRLITFELSQFDERDVPFSSSFHFKLLKDN